MPHLYTIGHSTRTQEEFVSLLHTYSVTQLVDVRSIPKSRHVPWFNKNELNEALHKEKIRYRHMPALGGLRHVHKDSMNQAWSNPSFRGFADYMQTPDFYKGLKELILLLKKKDRVAIMCAEAVPWRCHRSLIADALIVRGIHVFHIMSRTATHAHTLTSFAVVDRTKRPIRVLYPSENLT